MWNLGAISVSDTMPLSTMYRGERENQTGKICTFGNYCNDSIERNIIWIGKIGLIYPSDYAYASTDASCATDIYGTDSTCNINNWLHPSDKNYWTIPPVSNSGSAAIVWNVAYIHQMYGSGVRYAQSVRPSLYLKSNVTFVGEGNGTEESPYILGINE